jgi:hypothetical protein
VERGSKAPLEALADATGVPKYASILYFVVFPDAGAPEDLKKIVANVQLNGTRVFVPYALIST